MNRHPRLKKRCREIINHYVSSGRWVTAEEIAKAANAKKGTISNLLKNMKGLERKRMEKLYYWRRKN